MSFVPLTCQFRKESVFQSSESNSQRFEVLQATAKLHALIRLADPMLTQRAALHTFGWDCDSLHAFLFAASGPA
jgi:hypothetical protein